MRPTLRLRRSPRRTLLLLCAFLLAAFGTTAPAAAHGDLADGWPGPGDEVPHRTSVLELRFEDVDQDLPAYVVVLDADDQPLKVGDAVFADDGTVCAAMEPLTSGVHTVEYRLTSEDGHGLNGRYYFEVTEGADPPDAETCTGMDLPRATEARTLGDFGAEDTPEWVWPVVWGGLGLMLLGLVGAVARRILAERRA